MKHVKKFELVKKAEDINKFSHSKVEKLYQKVIDLIRSHEYKKLTEDEYYELGKKLKKFFNDNVIT